MANKIKDFLKVSNEVLVLICLAGIGSLIFNLYLMLELNSYQSVIVDRIEYFKGTAEYEPIIQKMKQNFFISGGISIFISCVAVFLFIIKKRNKN